MSETAEMFQKLNKARLCLRKEFEESYQGHDLDYVDDIAFYLDEQTEEYYQWKFITPDRDLHVWQCHFKDFSIHKMVTLLEVA